MIPMLAPLVGPEGTVTGMENKLVVRTTEENLRQLKAVLASLDSPPRRLMITVRRGVAAQALGREHSLSGRHRSGDLSVQVQDPGSAQGFGITAGDSRNNDPGASHIRYRTLNTHSQSDRNTDYRVQTLDGRAAFIQTGSAYPIAEHSIASTPYGTHISEGVRYYEANSGVYVVPRLNGNQVTLEVHPHTARPNPTLAGAFDHAQMLTTSAGQLGQWISLGGIDQNSNYESGVALTQTRRRDSEISQTWVMVEEL
jgi:type II secretory pathway component GspD/PulD (secretin)